MSMSYLTGHVAAASDRNNPYLLRFVFVFLWSFILLRFLLNANLLDLVIKYSAEGGNIVEKIHPSSYGLILVLAVVLLSFRIELSDWDVRAFRALAAFLTVIALLMLCLLSFGRSGSAGYLIDSYVMACIVGMLLLTFPPEWRLRVGTTLIVFIALSACVAVVEFALQKRLLPYWATETSFRPTGLTEHPLMLGLFCATAVSFVPLTRWRPIVKVGVTMVLLLGAFAAGARLAALAAAGSALVVFALAEWPPGSPARRRQFKALSLLGMIIVVPVAVAMLVQLGLVNRFQSGLFDESAMARVNIYGLFNLVSWNEILFGADIARIRYLAFEYFDLEFIESSIVMFVFQFGLFGTAVFLLTLARTFIVLLSGAGRYVVLGTCVFFIVASSNNALSSKTPIVMMIVLLVVSFHGRSAVSAQTVRSRKVELAIETP
jgi:hypothetical protein